MSEKERLQRLIDAALFVLGWMMGKCKAEGLDSWEAPVVPLAKALKAAGTECDHVNAILERVAALRGKPAPTESTGGS